MLNPDGIIPSYSHPMVVSMVMKARSFSNVCFVTDSVMEPKPGATVKYMGRERKSVCMYYDIVYHLYGYWDQLCMYVHY